MVLAGAAVAIRVVAAVALLVGPWTDEAAELAGWDVERFLAIAREGGRAWRDTAVEYPPGSVAVFELLDRVSSWLGADGLVTAHRLLVVVGLTVDLLIAWLLHRRSRGSGLAYLLVGLPLVPMGLLRLDLVAALAAVAATVLVVGSDAPAGRERRGTRLAAAGAIVVGAGVKLWPALVIPALWSIRRGRTAATAIIAGAVATLAWLVWAGAGLDPIRQVVDLRGATGWQLESVGGVATTLADAAGVRALGPAEDVRLELNAFRIGTLTPWVVTAGRALAVAAIVALAWRGRRAVDRPALPVAAAVMLGSVAALIVTSPLLSPQFLLWLTPWAALLVVDGRDPATIPLPAPVVLTGGATLVTGAALTIFAPPDLADPVAASMLAVRNALLVALPISCWRWLGRSAPPSVG